MVGLKAWRVAAINPAQGVVAFLPDPIRQPDRSGAEHRGRQPQGKGIDSQDGIGQHICQSGRIGLWSQT